MDEEEEAEIARERATRMAPLDPLLSFLHPDRPRPGSEPGGLGELRYDLYRFLRREPVRYDVSKLLLDLRETRLFEERVVLHMHAREHRAALELILFRLHSTEMAEAYCRLNAVPGRWDERGVNPFMILVLLCFACEDRALEGALRELALRIMHHHAEHLDHTKLLAVLPSSLSLEVLKPYMYQVIPTTSSRLRCERVARYLHRMHRINVNLDLIAAQQRSTVITRDTVCAVSGKRIGDSVFVVTPEGKPVLFHVFQAQTTTDMA